MKLDELFQHKTTGVCSNLHNVQCGISVPSALRAKHWLSYNWSMVWLFIWVDNFYYILIKDWKYSENSAKCQQMSNLCWRYTILIIWWCQNLRTNCLNWMTKFCHTCDENPSFWLVEKSNNFPGPPLFTCDRRTDDVEVNIYHVTLTSTILWLNGG